MRKHEKGVKKKIYLTSCILTKTVSINNAKCIILYFLIVGIYIN